MLTIPDFSSVKELHKYLVRNKNLLITQKKNSFKTADAVPFLNFFTSSKDFTVKAEAGPIDISTGVLQPRCVINTTNILDSHRDLHLPGLWKKSLSEYKELYHLQEHNMTFEKVISDGEDLKPFTKTYTWKELGFDYEGKTEALVFDSTIRKDRNPFMFEQYAKKRVKNHSVGMRYVHILMAINNKEYGAEYEVWEKYITEMVNPEDAEDRGYFWAIKEAKAIEGSAVLRGSNFVTPTLDTGKNNDEEPGNHSEEPLKSTLLDYSYLRSNLKINL